MTSYSHFWLSEKSPSKLLALSVFPSTKGVSHRWRKPTQGVFLCFEVFIPVTLLKFILFFSPHCHLLAT